MSTIDATESTPALRPNATSAALFVRRADATAATPTTVFHATLSADRSVARRSSSARAVVRPPPSADAS
jgi:hypothetical protein